MSDVFVSYSREDQEVARRFAASFEREGFSVWWDQALSPGEAFDQVTEQAFESARAVVVLWSKTSVNSRWVRAEATQAHANQRLLPVMIEACRRPIMFELTHTADLSGWDGDVRDPAWQSVVASVRRYVEQPTQLPAAQAARPTPDIRPAQPKKPLPRTPRFSASGQSRRRVVVYGAASVALAAAGFAGGALYRGGAQAPQREPTFQRLTFRRGLVRSARFAPDGQTILYGALWDGDACRIHGTRTDNPESRALELPGANLLAVSRSGDLALCLGSHLDGVFTYGTLARVPIAGGAPRELAEEVKFADWSPDGTQLAVIRNVGGSDRLEAPLGTVQLEAKAGARLGLGFVRFSPDGRRLAFVQYRDTQSLIGKVCVVDAAGRVSALTGEYVNIHGLAWRGDELLYTASDDRPLFRAVLAVKPGAEPRTVGRVPVNLTLWDVAADGRLLIAQTDDRSAMIRRLQGDAHDLDLSWLDASSVADISPDGRKVLFAEFGQGVGAVPAAYLRGIDGSPAVRLANGQPMALSPDGKWALILDGEIESSLPGTAIDIVPTGAGDSRRLLQGQHYSGARWLPDGGALLLRMADKEGPARLHYMSLPSGTPRAITPEGVRAWAVSPDGLHVAVTGVGEALQIYSVSEGAAGVVPATSGREELIGWIRDGLLLTRRRDAAAPRGQIYVMDPGTGRQRPWSNVLPRDSAGLMIMSTFESTPDGVTSVFTWHRALSNLYIANGLA